MIINKPLSSSFDLYEECLLELKNGSWLYASAYHFLLHVILMTCFRIVS